MGFTDGALVGPREGLTDGATEGVTDGAVVVPKTINGSVWTILKKKSNDIKSYQQNIYYIKIQSHLRFFRLI